MKFAFVLASVVSAVSPDFDAYKENFGKTYASPALEEEAKKCWIENVKIIEDHAARNSLAVFKENVFTDQCWEEFVAQRTGQTFIEQLNGICTKTVDPYPDNADESKAVDLRSNLNPVKDQGSCGSCWAFSTVGALEGAHFRATGELVSFAEQVLVSCDKDGNNGCQGGMPGEAMDWVAHNGIALEADYPYTAKDDSCRSFQKSGKFTGFRYIDSIREGGERKLLTAVQKEGPVSIVVNANNAWQSYHGGILGLSDCPNTGGINHAVLAVGYGQENGEKYWIIRNSWGTSWGESGYIRMTYNVGACSVNSCFAALPLADNEPVPPPSPVPPSPPPPPTPPPTPPQQSCSFLMDQATCSKRDDCHWCTNGFFANKCFDKAQSASFCPDGLMV